MLTLSSWAVFVVIQAFILLLAGMVYFLFRAANAHKAALLLKQKNMVLEKRNADLNARLAGNRPRTMQQDAPALSSANAGVDDTATATEDENRKLLRQLGVLRQRLATSETRIENLEKFRNLYFKTKKSIETMTATQEKLTQQITEIDLPEQTTKDLNLTIENLRKEKQVYEEHLKQVQDQLEVMMSEPRPEPDSDSRRLIQQQLEEIGRLTQIISELKLEASSAARMTESVTTLNEQADELNITIEVMQEENLFLQDQIQALLQQERALDQERQDKISQLESQLLEAEQKYQILNAKHAELETEYLRLQEDRQ